LELDFALSARDGLFMPQLLNAKEKRNQQAELTAVKSMLASHVAAAASLQEQIEAAEAQVNGSKNFFVFWIIETRLIIRFQPLHNALSRCCS
jgi:hypothetical protein